jgi:hypothetical protein
LSLPWHALMGGQYQIAGDREGQRIRDEATARVDSNDRDRPGERARRSCNVADVEIGERIPGAVLHAAVVEGKLAKRAGGRGLLTQKYINFGAAPRHAWAGGRILQNDSVGSEQRIGNPLVEGDRESCPYENFGRLRQG